MAQGTLYIVSAPSGAGKTSLLKALIKQEEGIRISVSHTTRPKRPGEQNGVDYWFTEEAEFRHMIEKGAFIEYALVFGNLYGTSENAVRELLESGVDVVLEIDWQGARQVRKRFSEAVSVFILPPTPQALQQRLDARGQDSKEVVDLRMLEARSEMEHFAEYDYLVVNDQFEQAMKELQALVVSQRLTQTVQSQRLEAQLKALLD
ncbi:MAG: guanylate kinase [Gammaproteobacteria bacterium]|nr:guanylate kinase [Gammaproteobacteria bacterium]